MYKSYIPYLQHILDECLYIRSVITDDMTIDQFMADETLKRAVTRSLSIIGEATKKVPADVIMQPRRKTINIKNMQHILLQRY